MINRNTFWILGCMIALGIIPAAAIASPDATQEVKTEYYHVIGNEVDGNTFLGWRQYEHSCIGCHGPGGSGSDIAPDLTVSLSRLSPAEFETKVLHRYMIAIPGDEINDSSRTAVREAILAEISKQELRDQGEPAMPQWKNNPAVLERVKNLYSYLKARADGVIGTERLELLKE